jgi:tetratricopeptide (TPR) repeat protein
MAEADREIGGKEVAITGRLASMTRKEAVRRITAAGGRYALIPGQHTDMLIIGCSGLPLGRDGYPTRNMQRAQELREQGRPIRFVSEEAMLSLLGLEQRRLELERLYTTSQLARMLSVPSGRVRSWVRSDLIRPVKVANRLCFFGVQQVASARALQQLLRLGVPVHQIHRGLEHLGSCLPGPERRLLQLDPVTEGGPLLTGLHEETLAESSRRVPQQVRPLRSRARDEWFEVGIREEEEGRLQNAAEAYRKALATGGPRAEICFNLGNTLFSMGRMAEAAQWFTQATDVDPNYVEAWNNLGNALSGTDLKGATDAYRRAISQEPGYADAHYNLAESLASAGDLEQASQHWRAYLRLDPHSPWADEVRLRLKP